jgi:hypothetical protein
MQDLKLADYPMIKLWRRETIIDWLAWNDRNGVYTDKACKAEGMKPLSKKEALQTIKQILEDNE